MPPLDMIQGTGKRLPRRLPAKGGIAIASLDTLREYPFLRAALEDIEEFQHCVSCELPNRRHAACLMFDALEFVLYEILLIHERDIYRNGQHTMGFDDALNACLDIDIEIPLIGAVRQIQKQRGDAKHHAQSPDETAHQRLLGNFAIITARLIIEQFESVLGDDLAALPLLSHEVALFESYRRRRNHNWKHAYRFVLGALLRKHWTLFGNRSGRPFDFGAGHSYQLAVFESEVADADYDLAPREAAESLKSLVAQVKQVVNEADWTKAATLVATAYSTTDRLVPGIFDLDQAKRLSSRLYQPKYFRYGKPMGWAKVWGRQGSEEAALAEEITSFLRANPDVVAMFGEPHYETDDDRFWRWWEFAIFDGERWHSFHLDTSYRVSLETGPDSSTERAASADLLRTILAELKASMDN